MAAVLGLRGALTVFLAGVGAWLVLRWVGDVTSPRGMTAPERVPFAGGYAPPYHS